MYAAETAEAAPSDVFAETRAALTGQPVSRVAAAIAADVNTGRERGATRPWCGVGVRVTQGMLTALGVRRPARA